MDIGSTRRRQTSGSDTAISDVGDTDVESVQRTMSRRKIFRGAVGVAAVGAAGASVLAKASPAAAATTTEQGGLAPSVVALTNDATIVVDASLGNDFRVTITGNQTMGNPANPTDGQKIVFQITQGAGGSNTITWGSGYEFSTSLPQPTLSTKAGQTDLLGFIYNSDKGKWLLATYVNGFSTTIVTPPSGNVPALPFDQRAVQSGVLQRRIYARCRVSGHPGRNVARRVLVVGLPVRAIDFAAEVRALAGI